jgi:A-macroglobulin TED domain/Alpha-2-macroglobulin family
MPDRDRYRALMLEHLYGLLEVDEVRELEAYLATPDGAALKAEGKEWQSRLAGAAKVEFPEVRFAPPAPAPRGVVTPSPERTAVPMKTVWSRWLVTASLLFVGFGLGGPAAYQVVGWHFQSREVHKQSQVRADRQQAAVQAEFELNARRETVLKEHQEALAAQQEAETNYHLALENARKAIEQKDFMLRLTGPERIQPGAPNEWRIETLNRQGAHVLPKSMEVVVRDQAGAELLREPHSQPLGPTSLKLPTSFWEKVKPGSDLFLEVIAVTDDNRKSVLAERVPLARPVYVTHLATDKPLYKPGETVRFRSLTLDRATFLPPDREMHLRFRLRDPSGALTPLDEGNGRVMEGLKPVLGPDKKPLRGIGVGECALPAETKGGEYALEVVEINERTGAEALLETRKFLVSEYRTAVFEKTLEFDGKSYGPGDTVQARVEVSRTEGGPMTDAAADVFAMLDDGARNLFVARNVKFHIVPDPANPRRTKAVYNIRFKLPKDLLTGRTRKEPANATLAVTIRDGSERDVITRPIPLVEKELKVEFFPEGGDLVEAVPCRVYFQVRTPRGRPADLKGIITDGTDTLAEVSTLTDAQNEGVNRGQGVFTLTPRAGKKYFLKLKSPVGITEETPSGYPLPSAKPDGVVLTSLDPVTENGAPIRVQLQTAKGPKTLHVGAYARGRLISHQRVVLDEGKSVEVKLQGDEALGGVTRVTVFEEPKAQGNRRLNLVPKAERLVYRKPGEQLILSANPDKGRYGPAGKVNLELSALNEKNQPVPAVLLVAVVNQSVIRMADLKTDRLMPTHFLLSGDVKDSAELEHADFLLTDHPLAAIALDRLLGTQGWRRFAEQNHLPAAPIERQEVERMLVAHGQRTSAPVELFRLEEQRVTAEFRPQLEQAGRQARLAKLDLEKFQTTEEPEARSRVSAAKARTTSAQGDYETAAAELYKFETRGVNLRSWALPLFMLGLIAIGAGAIVFGVNRQPRNRRPYIATAAASVVLCALVIGGMILTQPTPGTDVAYANVMARQKAITTGSVGSRTAKTAPGGGGAPMPMKADARPMALPAGPMPEPAMKEDSPQRDKGAIEPKKAAFLPRPGPREKPKGDRILVQGHKPKGQMKIEPIVAPGAPAAPARPPGLEIGANIPAVVPPAPSSIVREYAHWRDASLGSERQDFTETVYWHPVLVLPEAGRATVTFQLSDDVARYQVLVAGHTVDGRVGAVTRTIEARKPFTVDPKLPLEITSSDVVDVPVRVVNDSDDNRAVSFTVTPHNLTVEGGAMTTAEGLVKDAIDLGPNGKGRKVVRVRAKGLDGEAALLVVGNSAPAAEPDSVLRTLTVVPEGFPGVGSFSDMLETRATGSVVLPKDVVKGTLKVRLEVYPTSMADLVDGLDGLLREPNGCFEQASTSNYPNSLILDYLNQTNQANPEASRRARELLDRGYAKLTGFECPDTPAKIRQGFEWFGSPDMAHEALTAYGLLQFKDMARVHNVDPELIKRTQAFLLSRKDGSGGFKRNSRALDTFGGAPKHTTDAYIVWALVESDPDDAEKLDLAKEIDALKAEALKEDSRGGKDAYFLALTANVLLQRGDRETAIKLLDRLKDKHFKSGAVTGAETSITRSGGRNLEIETTALAMLGWLRANDNKYAATLKDATRWLSQQRGGFGGFGATQATIMALKALVLHAKKNAHPAEAGEIRLLVGGKPVAAKRFTEKDVEVIALDIDNPEELFKLGEKTDVEVVTDAKHPYPFALSYAYTSLTPVSGDKCAVKVETKLARADANEGETVPVTVKLENRQKQGQGMAVAIVGLPAGMKLPTDMKQLIDLREKGVISFFETRGREVILYWRELAPEQKIELNFDLVCDVPGEYRGPASRAYLYYDADHKHWVEPLTAKIRAAAPKDEALASP